MMMVVTLEVVVVVRVVMFLGFIRSEDAAGDGKVEEIQNKKRDEPLARIKIEAGGEFEKEEENENGVNSHLTTTNSGPSEDTTTTALADSDDIRTKVMSMMKYS